MKSSSPLLVSLAAAAVLLASCQSSQPRRGNPRSASHWNAGFIGESLSYQALAANSYTPDTIGQATSQASADIVMTLRRHFFNDNPDNPLQEHRYGPYDRYIPILHMPMYAAGDLWDGARSTGVNTASGLVAALWMPVQVFGGQSAYNAVKAAPPEPEDFRVKNR